MTNEQIIMQESLRLVENGALRLLNIDGKEIPEPIHTFNGWKERGYSVKKGERSSIKFPIWKYTVKKIKKDDEKEKEKTSMFMKTAAFFTFAQVEKSEKNF